MDFDYSAIYAFQFGFQDMPVKRRMTNTADAIIKVDKVRVDCDREHTYIVVMMFALVYAIASRERVQPSEKLNIEITQCAPPQ